MEHILAAYLFQFKNCPLPGIGTLFIEQTAAQTDFLNKKIYAPKPVIVFNARETEATKLIDYVALKTNGTAITAIEELGKYCNDLKASIYAGAPSEINGAGTLAQDISGKIIFTPAPLSAAFLPDAPAERVIHVSTEHTILVGDKETTKTQMEEYYAETPVEKNYWWVWALALAAAALIAVFIYFNTDAATSLFGNINPIF